MPMIHCAKCGFANIPERKNCKQCGASLSDAVVDIVPTALPIPMVTSALTLPGFRIIQSLGVVRGLNVRSPGISGSIVASFQSLGSGNIQALMEMCERARAEAFRIMVQHAADLGANAVIGFAYDTTEIASGITEVLAYGTAVQVEVSS